MSKVYISRDEAIEAIEREFGDEANPNCIRAKEAVYSVELADVAPVVHGRWIEITADVYKCSKCTQLVRTQDIIPYRFCNVCAAKMDESEDNTNA